MDKNQLLQTIAENLDNGTISVADLQKFNKDQPNKPNHAVAPTQPNIVENPDKLSAVDVMFYIAGIVIYAAILSIIVQSWEDGSAALHIMLSAVTGIAFWALAYYLITYARESDARQGMTNAMLLTGSLCVVTGGYIIVNTAVDGFDEINFIPTALMLLIVGGLHLFYDRLIKRDITLIIGTLLTVAALPTLLFGLIQDSDAPIDVWAFILMISAGVLAYSARVVAKFNPDRTRIHAAFDSFAAFIALGSMYVASYGEYGLIWLFGLVGGVFSLFYLSIIAQNKKLLGSASFFLILTVITISFKYFSGFGATTSLILSAFGLLGSAWVASSINKKYFK